MHMQERSNSGRLALGLAVVALHLILAVFMDEAALDAEQKKYAVGKSTTFTVLQLQNNLTSARSAEIRALANYQEALTNLAQQEGTTLERRNVDVATK